MGNSLSFARHQHQGIETSRLRFETLKHEEIGNPVWDESHRPSLCSPFSVDWATTDSSEPDPLQARRSAFIPPETWTRPLPLQPPPLRGDLCDPPPSYTRCHINDRDMKRLALYDTIFVVDDSGSMRTYSSEGDELWKQACDALADFAEMVAPFDNDGIDVHFLNDDCEGLRNTNLKTRESVEVLFRHVRPRGNTFVARKLQYLLDSYLVRLRRLSALGYRVHQKVKPRNYIIITDGVPSDPCALRKFLQITAGNLDAWGCPLEQLGFQFVQIGNDLGASRYLRDLDGDRNKGNIRDIVDTVQAKPGRSFSQDLNKKILLGGINRHFDRKVVRYHHT